MQLPAYMNPFEQSLATGGGVQSPEQVYAQYVSAGYPPQAAAAMSGYSPNGGYTGGSTNFGVQGQGGTSLFGPGAGQPLTMQQAQQITQQVAAQNPQTNAPSASTSAPAVTSTASTQPNWVTGGGYGPGLLNAVNPDGPLDPMFQNMQANVQAGIAKNSGKPANYSLATNDPNVFIDPTTGGTWSTPGYGSYDPAKVFGTNPSLKNSPYSLPSGAYAADNKTGAVTPVPSSGFTLGQPPVVQGPPQMQTEQAFPFNNAMGFRGFQNPNPQQQFAPQFANPLMRFLRPQPLNNQQLLDRTLGMMSPQDQQAYAAFQQYSAAHPPPQMNAMNGHVAPEQQQQYDQWMAGAPTGSADLLQRVNGTMAYANPMTPLMNQIAMNTAAMQQNTFAPQPLIGPFPQMQQNPFAMMGGSPFGGFGGMQQSPFGPPGAFGNTGIAPTNNNPFAGMGNSMFTQFNPYVNGQQQVPFSTGFVSSGNNPFAGSTQAPQMSQQGMNMFGNAMGNVFGSSPWGGFGGGF